MSGRQGGCCSMTLNQHDITWLYLEHGTLLGGEVFLTNQSVDPFSSVHHLGNFKIGSSAKVGIGCSAIHSHLFRQETYRFTRGLLHRLIQIWIKADGDPVFGCLSEWAGQFAGSRNRLVTGL